MIIRFQICTHTHTDHRITEIDLPRLVVQVTLSFKGVPVLFDDDVAGGVPSGVRQGGLGGCLDLNG